jgi:N-acetyl sugar amidotransferase
MTFLRCLRCVMPNTRPDTPFVDGVCAACLSFERRPTIDWPARLEELKALIEKHKGRCIVPSSGGKDSTAQVLRMIELGAKPIVVTATTCHLTAVGRANIDNLAQYATTIEVTPNKAVRRKLNKIALETVADPSWPEHVTIHRTPFRIAKQLGIGLIVYGECGPVEYGGPQGVEPLTMTQRFVSEFGGFLGLRAADFVGENGITEADMEDYLAPTDVELAESNIEAVFLGQFEEWNSRHNAEVAIAHGFQTMLPCDANWWDFENEDNYQVAMHDALMYYKYGYGRGCAQVSVDVRNGLLSRAAALAFVEEFDGRFPLYYMGMSLEKILAQFDVTKEEYIAVCNRFLNRDLFTGDVEWGMRPILRAG